MKTNSPPQPFLFHQLENVTPFKLSQLKHQLCRAQRLACTLVASTLTTMDETYKGAKARENNLARRKDSCLAVLIFGEKEPKPTLLLLPDLGVMGEALARALGCADVQLVGYDLQTVLVWISRQWPHELNVACSVFDVHVAGWLLDSDAEFSYWNFLTPTQSETIYQRIHEAEGAPSKRMRLTVGGASASDISRQMIEAVAALLESLPATVARLGQCIQEQGLAGSFELEMKLVPVLAGMEGHGIPVDPQRLASYEVLLQDYLCSLEARAHALAGQEFLVTSPQQLSMVIYDKLQLGKHLAKISLTAKSTHRSTAEAVLKKLSSHHELPRVVLDHRQAVKIKAFARDYLAQIDPDDGRLRTAWLHTGTGTGRLSSMRPNLQNVHASTIVCSTSWESTGDLKGQHAAADPEVAIRDAFRCPPGMVFVSADYSEVEARILAHLCEDTVLQQMLGASTGMGLTFFHHLAAHWKQVPVETVTQRQRDCAKKTFYSVVYGIGAFSLAGVLEISQGEAQSHIDSLLTRCPRIKQWISTTLARCRESGRLLSLCGRMRKFPDIRSHDKTRRQHAERAALNFVVQGTAADIIKRAMCMMDKRVPTDPNLASARLLLQLHDELVYEVAEAQAQALQRLLHSVMPQVCPELTVGLVVKTSSGTSWHTMAPTPPPHHWLPRAA